MNTIDCGICEAYQSLTRVPCPFENKGMCTVQKCAVELIFWNKDHSPVVTRTDSDLIVLRDL